MTAKIYLLKDPITEEVRYIGQTRQELTTRLYQHWRERNQGKEANQYKANWISKLYRDHKLKPIIELVEEFEEITDSDLNQKEEFYIDSFLNSGCKLTNTSMKYYHRVLNKKINYFVKTIYCYDRSYNELVFESGRDVERQLGISYKTVSGMCYKSSGTNQKYTFSFKRLEKDEIDKKFQSKSKIGVSILAINRKTKEEIIFKSQQEAATFLQCNFRNINQVLKGLRPSCKNHTFKYLNQYEGKN